MLEAIKRY